jgi:Icc-related predicted phosphoesterase
MEGVSTFVYASDLHGNVAAYEALFALQADAVVLGGDLLPYPLHVGGDILAVQREFVEGYLFGKLAERPCYWILGNDDWGCLLTILEGKGTSLHGRVVPFLDGYSIAGYSCVPVTPFGMKDFDRFDSARWEPSTLPKRCLRSTAGRIEPFAVSELRKLGTIEEDLDRLAAAGDPGRTVYVMHSPPWATTLDRLVDGTPIGSRAIRAFIDRRQPPLTLHGHVHESPGVERRGRTLSVNPGDSKSVLRAVRVDLRELSVTPLP